MLFDDLLPAGSVDAPADLFGDLSGDDDSRDRAEATRFATRTQMREDDAASRPAFIYPSSGRDGPARPPQRPADAGVMFDGKTDEQRTAERLSEVGFDKASRQQRATQDQADSIRRRREAQADSGTIGPVSEVDQIASRARSGMARLGLPGASSPAGTLAQEYGDTLIAASRALPQTAALMTDVAQLLTAGSIGADAGAYLRSLDQSLSSDASFEHRGKAAQLAHLIEAGDAAGAASFLLTHPKFAVDTALPSVATMAPAVGGGALAARLASLPRAVRALPADEVAAIRAGAATAGANAANVGMNAGATYAETGDYGAAGTAGVFSALAGRFTRGGAEGAIARRGVGGALPTMAREGGQEALESLGQSVGQQTAENRFAPGQAAAQATVEGTLGAVVGGGAGLVLAAPPLVTGARLDAALATEARARTAEVDALLRAPNADAALRTAAQALARPNVAAEAIDAAAAQQAARRRDRSVELLRLPSRSDVDLQRLAASAKSPMVQAAAREELARRASAPGADIPVASDAELLARVDGAAGRGAAADLQPVATGSARPLRSTQDGLLVKADGEPFTNRGRALQAARMLGDGFTVIDFDGDGVRGYAVQPPHSAAADPQRVETARTEDDRAAPTAPARAPSMRSAVDTGAHQAAASPTNGLTETPGQIEANNRRLGHARIGGLDFSIENPEGSVRQDIKNDPPRWRVTMRNAHYGYIKGTRDNTGEHIDAYIKPGTSPDFTGPVYVVDQIDPATARFDEFKVMTGYASRQEAEATYDAHFDDGSGPRRRGAVTVMPWLAFREWLRYGDTTRPITYQQPRQAAPAGSSAVQSQANATSAAGDGGPQARSMPTSEDELILARDGRPFASRALAQIAADELGRGYRVARVAADNRSRGWAVKPPPPKEVRVRRRTPGAGVKDPLLRAIAQAGGISTAYFRELTGERYSPQTAMRLGLIEVFRAGGRPIDQIADEVLVGRFLTAAQIEDNRDIGGTRAAADLIAAAIRGRNDPNYRPPLPLADDEAEYERLRDRALDAASGQQPAVAPDNEWLAERAAIAAEADAFENLLTDDDLAAFADPGAPVSAEALRELGFSDDEIATLQAEDAADAGRAQDSRAQAGGDGPGPPRQGGRRADASQGDQGLDPGGEPLLANPTPADLQARERRQQQAGADGRRQDAAPASTDFVLTGSDRAVDEAEARGQTSMFDGPLADPVVAAAEALQDAADALKRAVVGGSIQDVGEKIGGARKDTATRTGARPTTAKDDAPGWRRRYVVSQVAKSTDAGEEGRWLINDSRARDWSGQPRQIGNSFATREDAEAAVPLAEVARNHRVGYTRDETGAEKFVIWRNISDRKRVQVVQQLFDSEREAKAYMAANAVAIIETRTSFGEEILPRPDRVTRTGPARRDGDAKGEDFLRDFGFRAVEFGLWEAQDERQTVMNHAYDALADLADVLGVPPRALGLNGELALAFGARGQGLTGARAHYERDYGVINLTKMSGAGSLAHEWMHAADHYFGRQDGKASGERVMNERGDMVWKASDREDDYASHGTRRDSRMRADLKAAYDAVIEAIRFKAEQYVEDTQKADRFVAEARDDVANRLQQIRDGLARQLEYGSKRAPATPEQLARYDEIAEKIIAGEYLELEWRQRPGSKARFGGYQWSNDALDSLSAVYKDVRGRGGRTEQGGPLADLAGDIKRYGARLTMLADAQAQTTKTRRLPTAFTTEAKRIDQGRASDYWATPHELLARAFQAYVEDRVAARGGQSDFLTYGTNTVIPTPWGWARPFPTGAEREAINAAFDRFVQTLQTRETDAGVAMFDLADSDAEFAREVLDELAQADPLFRFPVSQHRTLDAVFKDVLPDHEYAGDVTREDEKRESGADRRDLFRTQDGTDYYVFERGREVWIDVSRLQEGERGGGVYAAVLNYAHNAGKVLIGDPAGLSEAAVVRRTRAMLSSALRFGTTRHMDAAAEQRAGNADKGIAPLAWQGDDAAKTRALIDTFLVNLEARFPQLDNYAFDFGRNRFVDRRGRPVDAARLDTGERNPGVRAARAGEATLRAGILIRSLVRSEGSARPRLLEAVLRGAGALARGPLRASFDLADSRAAWTAASEAEGSQAPARDANRATEARLVSTLQGLLRDRLPRPGLVLDHVPAGDGRVLANTAQGRALRATREFARRALDVRVVFIEQPAGELAFNGVVHDAIPGAVFLDIDSTKPIWALFGHELLHRLRRDRPDVYADLLADLVPLLRPEYAAKMRALNDKRRAKGYPPIGEDLLREEFIADVVGDRFAEPAFWEALAARNPSRFRRIADAVLAFLDDMLRHLRAMPADVFGTARFLLDLQRARAAVAKAVDRYAQGERVAGTDLYSMPTLGLADALSQPTPDNRLGDRAAMEALRRAAALLERPRDGIFFRVTDDSRAIATGPKGVRIPDRFRRFADQHGLTFVAEREGIPAAERRPNASPFNSGVATQSEPMPGDYRQSGALYAAEVGGNKPNRTDRARFDLPDDERTATRTFRTSGGDDRPRLLAKAIADEFQAAGTTALVGKDVRSPEDLAALAQVYRDPRYETLRVLYTRGATIVHATAVSSRLPQTSAAFPLGMSNEEGLALMLDTFDRVGADGYYLLHNHPSGDPTPSRGDLALTAQVAARVPGLRAHVVVNSNRYGVLTPRADPYGVIPPTAEVVERYFGDDTLLTPALPADLLGRTVDGARDIAAIGKSVQREDWIGVVGVSRGVRALAEIPPRLWSNPLKLRGWLRRFARGTGASAVYAWSSHKSALLAAGTGQIERLIGDGFLRDAVWGNGRSMAQTLGVQPTKLLGYDTAADAARSVSEAVDRSGGDRPGAPRSGNPLNRWGLPSESNFSAVRRRLQDYLLRLKVVQDAIAEQGGTVGVPQDAYRAEERMHGRIQTQLEQFKAERMRPLMQKLATAGLTPDDLALYAYARHAPERNRYIERINPELRGNGSGMSDREASEVLDSFLRDGRFDALEDAHRDLLAITKSTRRRLVEAGLISGEQFEAWEAMFGEYVPLRGFERVEIVDGRPEIRPAGGIDVRGPEAQHASGRTSRAGTLIENVILDYERAVVRAERNAVAKVFLDLVTTNPDPALWEVDAPRDERTASQLALFDLEQATRPADIDRGDDTIAVKVGGRPVYIRISDPLLLRAMRRAYLDETGDLQRVIAEQIGWYANWLRNTLTRWNPAFVVVNAIRDAQTGAVSTLDTLGWGATARYTGYFRAALAAAWRNERGRLDPAAREWDRWFQEYKAAGGITGGFFMRDASDVFDELRAEILDAGGSLEARGAGAGRAADRAFLAVRGLQAAKLAAAVLRGVEMLGGASENAARVAAYRTARELGKSAAQAASIAKNLTVNFNRRGEWGTAMNSLYLFFNAAVQGSHRTLVALANPRVQAAMAGMTAMAVALALGNAEWGGDDEDGEANWDKVPDFVKERNLVIMLPPDWDLPGIEDQAGRAKYLKLPLPYGFNVFTVLGNALADGLRNARDPRRGVTPAKSAINLASAVAGSFNPIGGSFDPSDAVQLGLAAAPTILDLPVQLAAERDTWGRPAVPARSAWDARPDAERLFLGDAGTPQQRLSRWLNTVTGGDRARSGMIDIAPGSIETAVRATTGGLGQFMADVLTTAGQFTDARVPVSPSNVPILKALYGQADNRTDQARFYENRKEIEEKYRQSLAAMRLGISVDLSDPEDRAVMLLGEQLVATNRFLTQLRRQELAVIESDRPDGWKRVERQRIDAVRTQLMKSFNRTFSETFKPARAGQVSRQPEKVKP